MLDREELELTLMNEVKEELCSKCNERYWEKCSGIESFVNSILGCNKAMALYYTKLREVREKWLSK